MLKLPLKIAEFINENYPGKNYVSHKKEEDHITGVTYYVVHLHDDDDCYQLKFTVDGKCVAQNKEPLRSDYHEQYY